MVAETGVRVRDLTEADFEALRRLYNHLTAGPLIEDTAQTRARHAQILSHPGTTVLGAEQDGEIRALATLHLMPNLTNGARPYGLVENVVTNPAHRGQGLGRAVLTALIELAWRANAYKLMVLTGQGRGALGFYEKLGFSAQDKHGLSMRR